MIKVLEIERLCGIMHPNSVKSQDSDKRKVKVLVTKAYPRLDHTDYRPSWFSEETLQITVKRKEVKGKGEKERYTHLNAHFQRIARRDKNSLERLENSSRKLEIPKNHFMQI